MFLHLFMNKKNQKTIRNKSDKNIEHFLFQSNLCTYLLIPFHRYMPNSMFDFTLNLKNIKRINKRKTQDNTKII